VSGRDVLIPEQLSVTPRVEGTRENDYNRHADARGESLWISATGEAWLDRHAAGEAIIDIATSVEPNYRRGAVLLFFVLAERALQSGWVGARDIARVGYPKTVRIGPAAQDTQNIGDDR